MEDEGQQTEKISLYNSGMAQIKRLDELWAKIHKYAEGGLMTKWNWGLDRIWCELVGDLEEESEEEDKKDSPIAKFENFKVLIGNINNQFIQRNINVQDYQRNMYEALMEKEAFLRRLQNKLGKGTKLVDADEDFIE